MNKLIYNEIKKQNIILMLAISIALFFVMNMLVYITINDTNIKNWREMAQKERTETEEFLEHAEHEGHGKENQELKESFTETIREIDYCLTNDIPYGVVSMGAYLINVNGMDTFVFLIIIVFAVRVFGVEDENKTWKNLYTTSMSKQKIICSKILFSALLAVGLSAVFFCVSTICATIFSGAEFSSTIRIWNVDHYDYKNVLGSIAGLNAIFVLKAMFFAMFTVMISSLTKKSYITYLISLWLLLFGEWIVNAINNDTINNHLPFRYLYTTSDNFFGEKNLLLNTAIALIPFIIIFSFIPLCKRRRDV